MHEKLSSALLGRTQVRPPKVVSATEPAYGCMDWPPNLAPKSCVQSRSRLSAAEGDFRPPKVPDFRLWREGSAAEGAAEPA